MVSVLPLLLVSVGCRDDEGSSPVDAGGERDGSAQVTFDAGEGPSADAAAASSSNQSRSNDDLTLDLDPSVDELTIVEPEGSTADGTSFAAPEVDASTSEPWATSSAASSATFVSTDFPPLETDVLTLAFDTATEAVGTTTDVDSDAGTGSTSVADAGATGSIDSTSTASEGDAAFDPLTLEGCSRVLGERPATTPTLSAPQVAGLSLGTGVAGAPLSGTVQFVDAQNDATTLIVQVGAQPEHYRCALTADDLQQGSANLGALTLGTSFTEGGHTLYVGIADAAGNVSGYIAGALTVGEGGAQAVCGQPARLLIGAVPSQATTFYAQQNGYSEDYTADGDELAVVASTDLHLKLGGCTALLLAGDAAGSAAIGWDNCLLVEYRPSPGAPREAVWAYCSLPLFDSARSEPVLQAVEQATVPGTSLTPPVPNALPFGWPAQVLDLMRYVPGDHPNEFVLSLRLLDFGSYGSTTDIWLSAESSGASSQ